MIFGNPIYRQGRITGRRGIIIDISERKKYEIGLLKARQELEQVNNNLEQIVAWSRSRVKLELNPKADDDMETIVSIDRATEFKKWLNA